MSKPPDRGAAQDRAGDSAGVVALLGLNTAKHVAANLRLFPMSGDNISAVADVSRCFDLPDRECVAIKCWHGERYVLGRFFPGTVPEFASDAATPIETFNGQHRLRKRRPVDFGKVMILPLTGWIRKLAQSPGQQPPEGDQP